MRPGDGQCPRAYLDRQPYFQEMPRFFVFETGVHMIDVFRFLLGEVTGVFARLRRLNPAIRGEDAGLITATQRALAEAEPVELEPLRHAFEAPHFVQMLLDQGRLSEGEVTRTTLDASPDWF